MRGRSATLPLIVLLVIASLFVLPITGANQSNDDCPDYDGSSSEDRIGCLDSDGDGWSDPDENWTISDGADAFVNESTQWSDLDKDGYGDNSNVNAKLIDYFPNDGNLHRAVLSIGCNPPDHTLPLGQSSHFLCTVKNEGLVPIRVHIEWDTGNGIRIDNLPEIIDLKQDNMAGDSNELRLDFTATEVGLTKGTLYFNESSDTTPIYSISLGVLVNSVKSETSSSNTAPSLNPVIDKANSFAGWLSAKTNYNFSVQTVLALVIVIPLVLFVIAKRSTSILQTRRIETKDSQEETSDENKQEENQPTPSIHDMANAPNKLEQKPKRGVRGAEGKVLSPDMVEVIVGELDLPSPPNDAFKVLNEELNDTEIEGEEWSSELEELEDNLETKVSAKNRIDTKPESFEAIVTKEKEKLPKKTSPIIIDEDIQKKKFKKKSGDKKTKKKKGKVGHTRGPGIELDKK